MPVVISCPLCGSKLSLAEEFQGKKLRCGHCKQVFVAPTQVPPPEAPPAEAVSAAPPQIPMARPAPRPNLDATDQREPSERRRKTRDEDSETDRPLRRRGKRHYSVRRTTNSTVLIGAIVGGIVLCCLG